MIRKVYMYYIVQNVDEDEYFKKFTIYWFSFSFFSII